MPAFPRIYAVATMDTKGRELAFVGDRIRAAGGIPVLVDVGTAGEAVGRPDVGRGEVASFHPKGAEFVLGRKDRGEAVGAMAEALRGYLGAEQAAGRMAGVIGLGGSGGTALLAPAFRDLPVGLPKVLVSTVASGNTAPYVGASDLALMPSVVDVAGLNRVSRQVLANAAHAVAGMAARREEEAAGARTAGMTMFGVTTPCVTQVREALEAAGWDCLVFHATGTGGQTMEKLAASGMIEALLDLTTTEVADEVVGGVFRAGPDRIDLLARREIPCVMSLGALDMVNFGAKETVPEAFRRRRLHVHNAQVTLMRTTPEENRQCARWIAEKANRAVGPLVLLVPEGGVSMLDAPGQPFHDPEADAALFGELERAFQASDRRRLVRVPAHINDPLFARTAVAEFLNLTSIPAYESIDQPKRHP